MTKLNLDLFPISLVSKNLAWFKKTLIVYDRTMEQVTFGSKFTQIRYLFFPASLIFFFYNLGLFSRNISDPSLWFDESGQYWMSQGQLHQSNAESPLLSIFQANIAANLDPGGFTLILHYWSSIFGSTPTDLRLLSFTFFMLLGFSFVFIILKSFSSNAFRFVALLALLAITEVPEIRFYAFEVRAYSFSYGMLSLCIALTFFTSKDISWLKYFSIVSVYIVTCTGRYSTILYVGLLFLILSYRALKIHLFSRTSIYLVLSSWTLFSFILSSIYLNVTRKQNYGTPPDYVNDYLLENSTAEQILQILKINLWSFPSILRIAAILLIVFVLVLPKYKLTFSKSKFFLVSNLFFLISTILFQFILSFSGLLPWYFRTRWSIEDWVIILYSLILILIVFERLLNLKKMRRLQDNVLTTLILFSFLVLLNNNYMSTRDFVSQPDRRSDHRDPVGSLLLKLPPEFQESIIYVESGIYPDVRYLKEASGLYENTWIPRAQISSFSPTDSDLFSYQLNRLQDKADKRIFMIQTTNLNTRESFVSNLEQIGIIVYQREVRRDKPEIGVLPSASWAVYVLNVKSF